MPEITIDEAVAAVAPRFAAKPPKRIPFFTIGDEDDLVEFTILDRVPKSIALQVLQEIRKVGYEAVLPVMFEKCLGMEAYQVFLARAEEIDDTDYDWIQKEIEAKVMGAVEGLGEGSKPGGRKSAGS